MPRRWIIRTLFLLPILLCLAGWLWSSTHVTGIGYGYGDRRVALGTGAGTLCVEWGGGFASPGWRSINRPLDPPEFWPSSEALFGTVFLGFSYRYLEGAPGSYRFSAVPYWFLIVIFGGVFAWVWRKTRRKPDPKTAFPVEVAAAGGERAPDRPSQTQTP